MKSSSNYRRYVVGIPITRDKMQGEITNPFTDSLLTGVKELSSLINLHNQIIRSVIDETSFQIQIQAIKAPDFMINLFFTLSEETRPHILAIIKAEIAGKLRALPEKGIVNVTIPELQD